MQSQPLAIDSTATIRPPVIDVPQLVGGRYRVLSLRGSGAEAAVYLAIDLFTDHEVALKVGEAHRLEAEYRACAALVHPHLARALTLWGTSVTSAVAFEYGAEDLTS